MLSCNVVQEKAEITIISLLQFLSDNFAICIFTLGSKFIYKGRSNDDLSKDNSIFKNVDNVWKIYWMQRS